MALSAINKGDMFAMITTYYLRRCKIIAFASFFVVSMLLIFLQIRPFSFDFFENKLLSLSLFNTSFMQAALSYFTCTVGIGAGLFCMMLLIAALWVTKKKFLVVWSFGHILFLLQLYRYVERLPKLVLKLLGGQTATGVSTMYSLLVMTTAATFLLLYPLLLEERMSKWLVCVVLFYVFLLGLGQVYFGKELLSEVLVNYLVGLGWVTGSYCLFFSAIQNVYPLFSLFNKA